MSNNSHYWANKDTRRIQAQSHTDDMNVSYSDEIKKCIANTEQLRSMDDVNTSGTPIFQVTANDSVSEIFAQPSNKLAVLNFASYKEPGGGFLAGSSAQEESLCMESYLYNVLSKFQSFYDYNKQDLRKGLYTDAALYSPQVRFIRDNNTKLCDVLTCASPNWSIAEKYKSFTLEQNNTVLKNRIQFIRNILESHDVDTYILGAWGCGVFRQDPTFVAQCFKEAFATSSKTIVFAVPTSKYSVANYDAFVKVFT